MTKKFTLEITIEDKDDEAAVRRLIGADNAYLALSDIAEDVFRPARKHGYHDEDIQKYFREDSPHADAVHAVVSALTKLFYDALEERGINLTRDLV